MGITMIFDRLSKRSRGMKMDLLSRYVPLSGNETILDIGSQVDNQSGQLLERVTDKSKITALNLMNDHLVSIRGSFPELSVVLGDARNLPFADKSFDLVYSNAVIEHVGDAEAQKQMAEEVRRVGKRWFITTPNRWFPFEFHARVPLISWLPPQMMHKAAEMWGYNHVAGRYERGLDYTDVHLMTGKCLQAYFPDSLVLMPRVTIWPETIVVVGPTED